MGGKLTLSDICLTRIGQNKKMYARKETWFSKLAKIFSFTQ